MAMYFLHSRFGFDVGKSVILSGYGVGAVCAGLVKLKIRVECYFVLWMYVTNRSVSVLLGFVGGKR